MIDQGHEPEQIFTNLVTPFPPSALRQDVLRAARAALARPVVLNRWEHIYSNRLLRAVWATAVIVLAVANVLMSMADHRLPQPWFQQEAAWRYPELRQVVQVPRLQETYVSLDVFAYRPIAEPSPTPDGFRPKEKIR